MHIATVALYLAGSSVFDDDLLARWIPPLTLIDWGRAIHRSKDRTVEALNPLYSIFRPLFDPENVTVNGNRSFPSAVLTFTNRTLPQSATSSLCFFRASSTRPSPTRAVSYLAEGGGHWIHQ